MIDKDDKILLRQIIMEHYTESNNKGLVNDPNAITELQSSKTCSDEITLQFKINNDKIELLKFEGHSCAISTASTDILCDMLINKNKYEAIKVLDNYNNFIIGKEFDENLLDELIAFREVYKQGNRINCALLGANGIKNLIMKFK